MTNFNYYSYLVLPLMIFVARIFDVSLGTIRIIMISRGKKRIAPLLGFVEVLVWISVINQIFSNLNNWVCIFGYAAGFASGNYIGIIIEEKLAVGIYNLRIIGRHNLESLSNALRTKGYGTTSIVADSLEGKVNIIDSVLPRNHIHEAIEIIKQTDPNVFYTVEDIKMVNKKIFPHILSEKDPERQGILKKWNIGK